MSDLSSSHIKLLPALQALLNHAHVTRAARATGVSQAAMSATLKQLRHIYKDELLVRGQHSQMTLTPLAESLKQPLEQTINQVKNLLSGYEEFNPATAIRCFHIGMSDHIACVLLPKLIPYLSKHASGISIIQHPINYMHGSDAFDDQSMDLVIGDFSAASDRLKSQALFSDHSILVMDQHHPLCDKRHIQLKDLLQYPHIFVSLEGLPKKNFILEYLNAQLGDIKVALYSPHTLASLYAVAGSNCIAHSLSQLAKPLLKTHKLCTRNAPYAKQFPIYNAKQYWPAQLQDEPGHRWLRKTIKQLC